MDNNTFLKENYGFIFGSIFGIITFAAGTIFGVLLTKLINFRKGCECNKKTDLWAGKDIEFRKESSATSNDVNEEKDRPSQSPVYYHIPPLPDNSICRSYSYTLLSRTPSSLPKEIPFKKVSEANSSHTPYSYQG